MNLSNQIKLSILIVVFALIQVSLASGLKDPNVAIHEEVISGNIEALKSLLSLGDKFVDINTKNELGWTPLHTAIRSNQKEDMIQLLLGKGADVNSKDKDGKTPLHFAVESGRYDIIQMLIATNKADINIADDKGDNALSLATKTRQNEIATKLTAAGAIPPAQSAPDNPTGRPNSRGTSFGRGQMSTADQTDPDSSVSSPPSGRGINRGNVAPGSPLPDSAEPKYPNDLKITAQDASQVESILIDPNEINARVKNYEGLEKALQDVSDKSKAGMRQWRSTDNDNRNLLITAVQTQLDTECEFLIKTAKEEKAEQTVKALEDLRTKKTEWRKTVSTELTKKLQEERLTTRTTTTSTSRSRTSSGTTTRGGSRGATGRSMMIQPLQPENSIQPGQPQPGQPEQPLGEQPVPQPASENDEWLSANVLDLDSRVNLAKSVNTQTMNEYGAIRAMAVEEKAEKTVAAIDGVLLAFKLRFDDFYKYIDQLKARQEKTQAQRGARATTTTSRTTTRSTTSSTGSTRGGQRTGR